MFCDSRQLLYLRKSFPCPEPKTNPSCFHMRSTLGCFGGLHAPETATTRPKILYIPLEPLAQELHPGCPTMLCGTGHIAQHRYTAIKNTRHTWPPNGRRSGTYELIISRCRFRTPSDGPRPHGGARPARLFVRFGRCGASGGPHARRPDFAATAAAATATAPGTAAAAAAVAFTPATRCRRFSLTLELLGLGVRSGSIAIDRTTIGPLARPPISAAPPHLDGADVLKDAGTPKTAPSVLHPPPVLALRNTGQYNGGGGDGDSGLEVVGVGEPTTFHLGVESGPMRPRGPGNHSPPAGSPIYGRRCQIRRADPM